MTTPQPSQPSSEVREAIALLGNALASEDSASWVERDAVQAAFDALSESALLRANEHYACAFETLRINSDRISVVSGLWRLWRVDGSLAGEFDDPLALAHMLME